jgi:uncharacterized phage-associated protein
MHSALAIANHFIQAALDQDLASRDFTPAKVHGLVYLAHGWLLGSAGAPIIKGQVMADRDGVFIPELRDAGCTGTKNVTALVSVIEMDDKRGVMVEHTPQITRQNPTVSALAWIWKTYGPLSSFSITQHIKESGSPWDQVWMQARRANDAPRQIPNATIKAWFHQLQGRRADQSKECKLSKTQQLERRPKGLDRTQQLLLKKH